MMVSIFPDLTGLVYMIVVPGVRNDPTHQRERRSQMVSVNWWFWCQCGWVGGCLVLLADDTVATEAGP